MLSHKLKGKDMLSMFLSTHSLLSYTLVLLKTLQRDINYIFQPGLATSPSRFVLVRTYNLNLSSNFWHCYVSQWAPGTILFFSWIHCDYFSCIDAISSLYSIATFSWKIWFLTTMPPWGLTPQGWYVELPIWHCSQF